MNQDSGQNTLSTKDIRPGEVAVPLPAQADASLYFIGRIHTPWKSRKDAPKNAREARETGAVCTLEVDPRWQQALSGVETCSHLIVLYWMDQARRDLVVQAPAHYSSGRGTFALRSPVRPNPIALSVVRSGSQRTRASERGTLSSALTAPGTASGTRSTNQTQEAQWTRSR